MSKQKTIEPEVIVAGGQNDQIATVTPMSLMATALEKGVSPDTLSQFMTLQERYERNEAAKKFAEAIAGFQSECPMVFKKREVMNNTGKRMYSFANYEDIMHTIRDLLKKWEIVITFTIDQPDTLMKGTVHIRVGTHVESSTLSVPVPKGMNTNDTQNFGMAVSYLKRYLLCAALNIVVTGEDNDARGLLNKITPEQIEQINLLLERCEKKGRKVDFKKFLEWNAAIAKMPIDSLEDVPSAQFDQVMEFLTRKENQK